ncbi:DUF7677 family protein [Streptomyces cyaneofuscatus]|uniref:DUF7677 family protein n=1 Tax=Streptomyces cyaneofuscatus TaxID=66883 RepID=UPI0034438D36
MYTAPQTLGGPGAYSMSDTPRSVAADRPGPPQPVVTSCGSTGLVHDAYVTHLPTDVRAAFRLFAFYLRNGTLDVDLLGFDYWDALQHGSDLEMVFAVFSNVLEVDEHGRTVNDGDAQYRVAQWIRARQDPGYVVDPPFEPWETELH